MGYSHICFYQSHSDDQYTTSLMYATNRHGDWRLYEVDRMAFGNPESICSIAAAGGDGVHIIYSGLGGVKYAKIRY